MIVLLTDFGNSEYVGVMKGVILSMIKTEVIDLCHDISPQCIIEAAWILKNNYKYFPKGSIFCCVVDPGVGSKRKIIAVRTKDYYFIAPDNGLLWETIKGQTREIIQIPVPKDASKTFHGRDVFAKTAANIKKGKFVGKKISSFAKFSLARNGREGIITRVDRFGNIITNLPSMGKRIYDVIIDYKSMILPYYETYSAAPNNKVFLIKGSNDTLEISIKNASAFNALKLNPGQKIRIK